MSIENWERLKQSFIVSWRKLVHEIGNVERDEDTVPGMKILC